MALLPDITGLLDDTDVGGGQDFVIIRTTVQRRKGRAAEPTVKRIPATGSVQPVSENQLNQLPEGDREKAEYIIRSITPFQNGSSSGTETVLPDEVEYNGDRYKLLKTKEWGRWGMYVAIVTRSAPSSASVNGNAGP